ncbi:MAG: peroxidase-related enzyme [Pseudomonadales bacterium]|nr:peroxidase-related enzyme [Pseudomonadales bacterium]
MARMKSLPESAGVMDVLKRFPAGAWQLCEFHDIKLREESPLSVGERELIAAYVSGLNACHFCYGAHKTIAEVHDMDAGIFDKLVEDPALAGVDEKLLPILAYVKKLTLTPSRMSDEDAEAVYAAGWDEQALYDAVVVCALFNFMNRIVDGCGVKPSKGGPSPEMKDRLKRTKDSRETYRNGARAMGLAP